MATSPDVIGSHEWISKGVLKSTWTFNASGVGSMLDAPNLGDKTVHVVGPTGGTTQCLIEGSNIAPSGPFTSLVDPQGNALTFTNAAMETILDNPRYLQPRCATVTAGAAPVVVTIISRAAR